MQSNVFGKASSRIPNTISSSKRAPLSYDVDLICSFKSAGQRMDFHVLLLMKSIRLMIRYSTYALCMGVTLRSSRLLSIPIQHLCSLHGCHTPISCSKAGSPRMNITNGDTTTLIQNQGPVMLEIPFLMGLTQNYKMNYQKK